MRAGVAPISFQSGGLTDGGPLTLRGRLSFGFSFRYWWFGYQGRRTRGREHEGRLGKYKLSERFVRTIFVGEKGEILRLYSTVSFASYFLPFLPTNQTEAEESRIQRDEIEPREN